MPAEIITQTCPAPECNLLPGDVEQFVEELAAYYDLFAPAFRRPEQTQWGRVYLNGLLGDLPRKTAERIALDLTQRARLAALHWSKPVGDRADCSHPSAAHC